MRQYVRIVALLMLRALLVLVLVLCERYVLHSCLVLWPFRLKGASAVVRPYIRYVQRFHQSTSRPRKVFTLWGIGIDLLIHRGKHALLVTDNIWWREICSTEECKLNRSIKPYALDINSKKCVKATWGILDLGVSGNWNLAHETLGQSRNKKTLR